MTSQARLQFLAIAAILVTAMTATATAAAVKLSVWLGAEVGPKLAWIRKRAAFDSVVAAGSYFSLSCFGREFKAAISAQQLSLVRALADSVDDKIAIAQSFRAARYLAISSKKSIWESKKKESLGAKESTSSPLSIAAST